MFKNYFQRQDFIYIQNLNLTNASYMEILGDNLYYISANKLYFIKSYQTLALQNEWLNAKAKPLNFDEGEGRWNFLSLFKLGDTLFCVASKTQNEFELLKISDKAYKFIAKLSCPLLESYIEFKKNKAFLLFHSFNKSFSQLFYLDKEKLTLLDETKELIYAIAYKAPFLYANFRQGKESVVKIVAKKTLCNSFKKCENKDLKKGIFYKILSDDKKLYLCPDNRETKIVDLEEKTIFAPQNCQSAQINSYLFIKTPFFKRTYTLLSAWRNQASNPKTTLFTTRNHFKALFGKTDSTTYNDKLKWTGYKTHKIGQVVFDEKMIFVNEAEFPCIVHFSAKYLPHFAHFKPKFNDDKSYIFENTIRTEEIVSIKNKTEQRQYDFSPLKPTKFFITIDTEQHLKNIPFAITGEGLKPQCGVYAIMDILEKYKLKGVFFVNIYEHKNFNGVIEQIIKDIDERGHEVALHHHSNESSPWGNKTLLQMDYKTQFESLKYGKDFIEKITKKPCVSFRGGAYLINDDTLKALEALGFLYESSAFALSKQDLEYKSINKISTYGDLVEFPINTNFAFDYISKIDINTQGKASLMLDFMQTHRQSGLSFITTMLHSFSFIRWYKGNDESQKTKLKFTGNRYAVGVNMSLMKEFEKFCELMSKNREFECITYTELKKEDIKEALECDLDILPKQSFGFKEKNFCPICQNEVDFAPYRTRKNALCPQCKSLERMRLKWLYLDRVLKLGIAKPLNILHIGPALCVYEELVKYSQHSYITSDPFSEAIYKYPLENLPFKQGYFELILCVSILMHVLDDDKCLKEMSRLLAPNGQIVLWLGNLHEEKTKEIYDRKDFHRMVATDLSYPKELHAGYTTELENGKLGYNPRFATRIYGKDILQKLENFGLKGELFYAKDIAGFEKYGLNESELLIIAKKAQQ